MDEERGVAINAEHCAKLVAAQCVDGDRLRVCITVDGEERVIYCRRFTLDSIEHLAASGEVVSLPHS